MSATANDWSAAVTGDHVELVPRIVCSELFDLLLDFPRPLGRCPFHFQLPLRGLSHRLGHRGQNRLHGLRGLLQRLLLLLQLPVQVLSRRSSELGDGCLIAKPLPNLRDHGLDSHQFLLLLPQLLLCG